MDYEEASGDSGQTPSQPQQAFSGMREVVHLDSADVESLLGRLGLDKPEANVQQARNHIDEAICKKMRV